MSKLKNKLVLSGVAAIAAFSFGLSSIPVNAAVHDQGTDSAKFQGGNGQVGYKSDKFSLVQIGGTYGGTLTNQSTYASQIKAAKARGLRAHTYLWYGVGANLTNAKAGLDYYLPRVKTPKGSIVALDYEDGASSNVTGNTNAILYGMRRVAKAGYTPMYYSYKPYTMAHVDYKRIIKEFPNSLWIAAYPNYLVTPKPNYTVFPTMDGVAIYQFTSMYRITGYVNGVAQGLDGDVDLTGITDNGYTRQPKKVVKKVTTKKKTVKKSSKAVTQSYKQRGVFYPNTTLNVRSGAGTGYRVVATYFKGESVIYDKVIIKHDYVWARYVRANGHYGYVALGVNGGQAYGSRYIY